MEVGVGQGGSRKEMGWGLGLGSLAQISLKSDTLQGRQVEETLSGQWQPVRLARVLALRLQGNQSSLGDTRWPSCGEREEKAGSSTFPDLPKQAACCASTPSGHRPRPVCRAPMRQIWRHQWTEGDGQAGGGRELGRWERKKKAERQEGQNRARVQQTARTRVST